MPPFWLGFLPEEPSPMTPEHPTIRPPATVNAANTRERVAMKSELPARLASMSSEPFFTLIARL